VDVDGPDTFERMMMGSRSNLYYTQAQHPISHRDGPVRNTNGSVAPSSHIENRQGRQWLQALDRPAASRILGPPIYAIGISALSLGRCTGLAQLDQKPL
jgi:hypothetical protein